MDPNVIRTRLKCYTLFTVYLTGICFWWKTLVLTVQLPFQHCLKYFNAHSLLMCRGLIPEWLGRVCGYFTSHFMHFAFCIAFCLAQDCWCHHEVSDATRLASAEQLLKTITIPAYVTIIQSCFDYESDYLDKRGMYGELQPVHSMSPNSWLSMFWTRGLHSEDIKYVHFISYMKAIFRKGIFEIRGPVA